MDFESIAIIHVNPQGFITSQGRHLFEYFENIYFKCCDVSDESQTDNAITWAISLNVEAILVLVPNTTEKTTKNVKAINGCFSKIGVGTFFILPATLTQEEVWDYSSQHGVGIAISETVEGYQLCNYILSYAELNLENKTESAEEDNILNSRLIS